MATKLPVGLYSAEDYEREAAKTVLPAVWAWLQSGSGTERTLRANRAAFDCIGLYNRLLRRCSGGSTRLELFGQQLSHPILLAPVAQHGLVHADGELATARGTRASDTVMVASTQSSVSMEAIGSELAGQGWFQLYLQPRRDDTLTLIRRAEVAGFRALVLTLDAPVQPASRAALLANFGAVEQAFPNLRDFPAANRRELDPGDSIVFQGVMADAPDWQDLHWLRRQTDLPIIAKGVSCPDDAQRLIEAGIEAIGVSNHGGRTLDGVPASLHLLQSIRQRVGPDLPVLLDGGVRSGSDVFKALALGANAVMIGRPQLHALAIAGALGVAHLIRLFRDELELTMALTGVFNLADITPDCLQIPERRPC